MTMRDSIWDDDLIQRLSKLWDEGHTTVEIGRRLHISKSAVVGKAHRIGLAARPSPIKRDGVTRPSEPPVPRVVRSSDTLVPLASLRIPLERHQFAALGRRPPQPPAQNVVQLRLPIAAPRACQYPLWGALHADDRPVFGRMCDDPRPGSSPRFCGVPAEEKSSYCSDHRVLAYRKVAEVAA